MRVDWLAQPSAAGSLSRGVGIWAGIVPKHIRQLEAKLAEHMQRRVLHLDAELLVLDKPAGLPVQGGDRIHVSLDSLLPHLRFGSAETPRLQQCHFKAQSWLLMCYAL